MDEQMNLDNMTIPELEAFVQGCMAQRQELKLRQQAAANALNRKRIAAAAEAKVAAMSDPERAALMQSLQAHGVAGEAKLGTPGGGR